MKRDEFQSMLTTSIHEKVNAELRDARKRIEEEDSNTDKLIATLTLAMPQAVADALVEAFERAGFIKFED